MESKRSSACHLYCFTAVDHLDSPDYYINWCKKWGKHWCFQLERGSERKQLHYQGIISLKVKRRQNELKSLLRANGELPLRITVSSTPNLVGGSAEFYVTKPDGRVAGPWTDKDRVKFFAWDIEEFKEMNNLLPWQKFIYDNRNRREKRVVNLIIDPAGKKGKSTFARLMAAHGYALWLDAVGDAERLSASLCDILAGREERDPKMIIIDLERSSNQKNNMHLYQVIEKLKNGRVCDTRYRYREWEFHPPQVWVFCNRIPEQLMLTADRWRIWEIDPDNELVRKIEELNPAHRSQDPTQLDVGTPENKLGGFPGASLSLHVESPGANIINLRPLEPLEPSQKSKDSQEELKCHSEEGSIGTLIDIQMQQTPPCWANIFIDSEAQVARPTRRLPVARPNARVTDQSTYHYADEDESSMSDVEVIWGKKNRLA